MHAPADGAGPRRLPHASFWLLLPALWVLACGTAPSVDGDPDAGTDPDTELPDGGDGEDEEEEEEPPNPWAVDPLPEEPPPASAVTTLEDQLRELGLDIEGLFNSPRHQTQQVALPGDHTPLGRRMTLTFDEFALAGVPWNCQGASGPSVLFHHYTSRGCLWREAQGGDKPTFGAAPNGSFNNPGTQSSRTLVAGDFLGNGKELAMTVNAYPSSGTWRLRARRLSDGLVAFDHVLPTGFPPVDTDSAVGDLHGDGVDAFVLLMLRGSDLVLQSYATADSAAPFSDAAPSNITHQSIGTLGGVLSVSMAMGQLDTDPGLELVVLVRSLSANSQGRAVGAVHAFTFDNPSTVGGPFRLLSKEQLQYVHPDGGSDEPWLTAQVAIADFDGDGLDEVAYTGIGRFPHLQCDPYAFVSRIHDDLSSGASTLATLVQVQKHPQCAEMVSPAPGKIFEVFADSVRTDAAPWPSLLANNRVLTLADGELTETSRFNHVINRGDSIPHTESYAAMAVGDYDGSGMDSVYTYRFEVGATARNIHGEGGFADNGNWSIPPGYPLIRPYNTTVNDGDLTLEYVPGSRRVLLSAPIIHAAIAAPPYDPAMGQLPAEADTRAGDAVDATLVELSAVSPLVLIQGAEGPEIMRLDTVTLRNERRLRRRIHEAVGSFHVPRDLPGFRATGRDAVLFSSLVYDAYDYRVVLGSDDRLQLHSVVTFLLPRAPESHSVSSRFFNDRVPAGGQRLDDLSHASGDIASYPSYDEALHAIDTATAADRWGRFTPSLTVEPGEAPFGVRLALDDPFRVQLETARTFDLALTGERKLVGFTSGPGEADLRLARGNATSLEGTLPPLPFDSGLPPYGFGMFSYLVEPAVGPLFPVVSYWAD